MIQFYKPNPRNTGAACSFNVSAKDSCVYVNYIKQASWDAKKKIGKFASKDPSAKGVFKLSATEVGSILHCLDSNDEFSAYHDSPKQVVKMKFSPYMKDNKQLGFSFAVTRDDKEDTSKKTSFLIGFYFGEAKALREYLVISLRHIFERNIKEAIKKAVNANAEKAPVKQEDPEEEDGGLLEDGSTGAGDEEDPW
jgi:hypothetical protein|tara:strand:+ start:1633 stop:2217 length:585 start_codon:yes stop_codon:yes gene_type:complete